MLLDNNTIDKTVFGWLEKYSEAGEMDIVTGYFTIGALSWLNEKFNYKIDKFRFVWGGIANDTNDNIVRIDLLNQDIDIEKALELKKIAIDVVKFLEQNKVEIKTSEPNFCHAKMFLLKALDDRHNFYITGSSNLTESGVGKRKTSNIELNIGGKDDLVHGELLNWFNNLWANNQKVHNAKQKFIEEISKIFKEYTPNDIYLKILAEMDLGTNIEIETTLGKSKIYNALYDFQKAGAVSLVKMLEQYNGAILADAVGLGKTWTALAVIKFYQKKGFDIVVICPKKLEHNWLKWKKNFDSKFKQDGFDYFIRFHTDLEEERLHNKGQKETSDTFFTSEKPKLFVIDESHNLRNDKSKKYNFLLKNILEKNENAKILMLSATPINNSFLDVRNQLKLIPQIQDIEYHFRTAQGTFSKWANKENPKITDLIKELHSEFLDITDKFIMARTRNTIEQSGINFPKWQKPQNYYETPNCIKDCKSFNDLLDLLPARFSAYMPAFYAEKINEKIIKNESQRDLFLVKMMHFLLVKRLESSWFSFRKTVNNILEYHNIVLEKISKYQDFESGDFNEDELEELEEGFDELGKKRQIKIKDIKNIDGYKKDLAEDITTMKNLSEKLEDFSEEQDIKLLKLLEIIKGKPKVLVFTTYKDTAEYLYKHISKNNSGVAIVTGDTNTKDIENILQKFAPLAKFEESEKNAECEQERDLALKEPIKILIATDVLSEGQNLQDCDFVINYDIHWNPVRTIQRMGRIDRLGSKHKIIHCANFWPTKDINEYLSLQSRIEKRMIAMKIAGSEIPQEFTDNLLKINDNDKTLEQRQIEKNLELMQNSIEGIENKIFGLNNLSLESFRQDLTLDSIEKYKSMPSGIFSGFLEEKNGLIALLKNKTDNEKELIFIDMQSKEILLNKVEILNFLRENRHKERVVSKKIDECDKVEIKNLSCILNEWFRKAILKVSANQIGDLFAGTIPKDFYAIVEQRYKPEKWDMLCWCLVSGDAKNET